jgi:hypothetical protein
VGPRRHALQFLVHAVQAPVAEVLSWGNTQEFPEGKFQAAAIYRQGRRELRHADFLLY